MSDMVPVTSMQLFDVLDGMTVVIRRNGERSGELVSGTLAYPAEVAEALADDAAAKFAEQMRKPPILLPAADGDPEAEAITGAIDALNTLGEQARRRVLRYLADRYDVTCTACEGVTR